MKRTLFAAVALTAAFGAAAVPLYSARSASAQYGLLIDVPQRQPAIDASFAQCLGSVCFDNQVRVGREGLASRTRVDPAWTNIHSVDAFTEAIVQGRMTLEAPPFTVPAPVPTEVSFRLSGSNLLDVDASSTAYAGMRLSVVAGSSSASLTEYEAVRRQPPVGGSYAMWRSGPDTVTASLTVPVGTFDFWLVLSTMATASTQLGQYDVEADYSLSFIPGQPVFTLPAGYTLSSSDFDIVDNHWCASGCATAPVPEPSGGWLGLGGLAAIAWRRRMRHA